MPLVMRCAGCWTRRKRKARGPYCQRCYADGALIPEAECPHNSRGETMRVRDLKGRVIEDEVPIEAAAAELKAGPPPRPTEGLSVEVLEGLERVKAARKARAAQKTDGEEPRYVDPAGGIQIRMHPAAEEPLRLRMEEEGRPVEVPSRSMELWEAVIDNTFVGLFMGTHDDVRRYVALIKDVEVTDVGMAPRKFKPVTPGAVEELAAAVDRVRRAREALVGGQ